MIYHTTVAFIFALFLTPIARALPQPCSDDISPGSQAVQQGLLDGDAQHTLAFVQSLGGTISYDPIYDNPNRSMNTVACSTPLASRYRYFGDIPNFPYIGGAFDVARGSPNCGACWILTNLGNGAYIYLTAIDRDPNGFTIGVSAFNRLKGDGRGGGKVDIGKVPPHFCGF